MPRTDLMDPDGENRALRSFLRFYLNPGITVGGMREEMESSGWEGCWPEWVTASHADTTLTKAGAQLWIRHLLSLEEGTLDEARYRNMREHAVIVAEGLTGRVTVNYRLPTDYRDYASAAKLLDVCVDAARANGWPAPVSALAVPEDKFAALMESYDAEARVEHVASIRELLSNGVAANRMVKLRPADSALLTEILDSAATRAGVDCPECGLGAEHDPGCQRK